MRPASADDVSKTVRFCTSQGIPFVAVCGGHSTSLSNCTDDGISIDLRANMRSVKVDVSTKTITAQGGAHWKDVDEAAGAHGLATVGGTVNHTGIGGLTLGGGYGWLSGKYGLVIDNLIKATVVLADGQIVECSEEKEPDLFWALRGAGQSFGIVTEFVYRGHEQGPIFGGVLGFMLDKLDSIVDFANGLHAKNDGNQGMLWGFSAPPPHNAPVALCAIFYNGPEDKARAYFKPLIDLGPVLEHVGMMPYQEMNGILNNTVEYGGRKLFGGSNFIAPLDKAFVKSLADKFFEISTSEDRANESILLFESVPVDRICEVPNNSMAFANRGEFFSVCLVWKWYDPEMDAKFREYNRTMSKFVRDEAGTKNAQDVGQYSNYIGADERTERVFGQNTLKLRQLKAKYDPGNWFSKWHNLLSN